MADDQDAADDERAIELSAISYIFPELVIDGKNPFAASLELPVAPVKPLKVVFPALATEGLPPTPPRSDDSTDEANVIAAVALPQVRSLAHLPALKLQITLPEGYPTTAAPSITLTSDGGYLSAERLKSLGAEAHNLWEERGQSEVLYDYIDFLQQAAEDAFGLSVDDAPVRLAQELELELLDFDLKAKKARFDQETFECGVCLEPKKGAVCHRLVLCGHVFCRECLQDFYNNCITEGDVTNVKCLAPKCEESADARNRPAVRLGRKKSRKKVDRTLNPSELLEIPLEQEQVQRYVRMKRKKELESDKNTVYCPRKWCQGAARPKKPSVAAAEAEDDSSESESEETPDLEGHQKAEKEPKLPPPADRLSICSECAYAFCCVCGKSWHGEIVNCSPPRRVGELTAEEKATQDYLNLHSTKCPTCDALCQKAMGCNHMLCYLCETHFCYLCSAWLDEANPYKHFNSPEIPCYQRLWELEEGDNGPPDFDAPPARARNNPVVNAVVDQNPPPPAREVQIQLVRFDEQRPPPPAPVAPAPAGGRNNAPPWEIPPGIRVNQRARQGLVRAGGGGQAAAQQDPNAQHGLQRFLAMVQDDREDEWDSDELDDDDEFFLPFRQR
jgi:E3 ubiquitin-protein ligase RNF14